MTAKKSQEQDTPEQEQQSAIPTEQAKSIVVNAKHDQTTPGGRYVVNGRVVNAEGQAIPGLSVVNGEVVEA